MSHTYTSVFLIIALVLRIFSIFTPITSEIQDDGNFNQMFLLQKIPLPVTILVLLLLLSELVIAFILIFDENYQFNKLHFRLLQISVLFWFILMSIMSLTKWGLDDTLSQLEFGHYTLWLAIWFEVVSLSFYTQEFEARIPFRNRRVKESIKKS
ncbi:MAG: hypothetical protein ACC656_13870 [Candidatus Heimdallarchaeota archaeon]